MWKCHIVSCSSIFLPLKMYKRVHLFSYVPLILHSQEYGLSHTHLHVKDFWLSLTLLFLFIYLCMHGHIYDVYVYACIPVEVRLGVLFSHPALFPWDRVSYWTWRSLVFNCAGGWRVEDPSIPPPPALLLYVCVWLFHMGAGHSNSGAHACTLLFFFPLGCNKTEALYTKITGKVTHIHVTMEGTEAGMACEWNPKKCWLNAVCLPRVLKSIHSPT